MSTTTPTPNPNPTPTLRPLNLGSYDFEKCSVGFTYPSLFEEADEMIKLSNLIYVLAEIRVLARNGSLDNKKNNNNANDTDNDTSLRILELPLPMETALSIIAAEADLLKAVLSDGAHGAALSAIQSLVNKQNAKMIESSSSAAAAAASSTKERSTTGNNTKSATTGFLGGLMNKWNNCLSGNYCEGVGKELNLETTVSTIIAVGDEKCMEELVYVVGINPAQKRITVAFRGSVTKADFLTDAKMDMVPIQDPRKFGKALSSSSNGSTDSKPAADDDESCDKDICIHRGFYDYLFAKGNRDKSKYEEILNQVNALFDENPNRRKNFKLYVTGHSLGGALSTLFGFYASASGLPNPVSIVSVASPRVGNLAFARTFTEFESQGKIRHLRIANHKDPVTLGPTVSSKRAMTLAAKAFSPLAFVAMKLTGTDVGEEETYYHTGMKMKLRKDVSEGGGKRSELVYSGARYLKSGETVAASVVAVDASEREETEVAEEYKRTNSFWNTSSDVPLVSYHYGTAYSERIALVESELEGMTLNKLYLEKTA